MKRRRVVVLGAQFGGLAAAHLLRRVLRPQEIELTVVTPRAEAVYRPDLVYAVLRPADFVRGQRVPIVEPLRRMGARVILDLATRIDPERRVIHLMTHRDLPYDVLFWATGMDWAWELVPGLGPEHGYVCDDLAARHVAARLGAEDTLLLLAGPLRQDPEQEPSLYASCECPLYELAHLRAWQRNRPRRILLVTGAPVVGQELGPEARALLARSLDRHRIETLTGVEFVGVARGRVVVVWEGRERVLPAGSTIWMPPVAGSRLARASGLDDGYGWVPTNGHMQHVRHPEIYAFGDLNRDTLPKLGHTAMVEARVAVEHFRASLRDAPPPPPHTRVMVGAMHLGGGRGLITVQDVIYGGGHEWVATGRWPALAKSVFGLVYRFGKGSLPIMP